MEKYKIGDFASYLGVTPDLLKHYEKYRIISSEKHGDGGYRFYDFNQAPLILESKKFQRMGFTLREIESLLNHGTVDNLMDNMMEKTDLLAEEIKDKQLVLNSSKQLCKVLVELKNNHFDGRWYIGKLPSFYFFPHSNGYNFAPQSKTVLKNLANWIDSMPVVEQCIRIFYDSKEYKELIFGLSINEDDAETLKLFSNEPVEKIEENWGLIYQSSQPRGSAIEQDFISRNLEKPLHILSKHHLNPNGDIFIRTVLETIKNNMKYYHRIITIPLVLDEY